VALKLTPLPVVDPVVDGVQTSANDVGPSNMSLFGITIGSKEK